MCEVFEEIRGSKYGFRPMDARNATELLALAQPAEIVARWRAALLRPGYPAVASFRDLYTHWNRFALSAMIGAPKIEQPAFCTYWSALTHRSDCNEVPTELVGGRAWMCSRHATQVRLSAAGQQASP